MGSDLVHDRLILVVEDQKDMSLLASHYLTKDGFQVAVAAHGGEALQMLEDGLHPDLILLDVTMPVMDGYAFLQAIHDKEVWNEIPVVMLTAHGEFQDVMKAMKLGAVGYCTKPFERDELLKIVHQNLGDPY